MPTARQTAPLLQQTAWVQVQPTGVRLLLVLGNARDVGDGPNASWTNLADVGRPGDKGERYRLYRLDTP